MDLDHRVVEFERGRQGGQIITHSIGKIGFPCKGWFPQSGRSYYVSVTEEREKVLILSPVTADIELDPYEFKPRLVLKEGELVAETFQALVRNGVELERTYMKAQGEVLGEVEVECKIDKQGVRFHCTLRQCGRESFIFTQTNSYLPPFTELPEKYRLLAEGVWSGVIVSPGIWVADSNRLPRQGDKMERSTFIEFRDLVGKLIGTMTCDQMTERVRLKSVIEGKEIYDGEIWEAYCLTPYGEFPSRRGSITTHNHLGLPKVSSLICADLDVREQWEKLIFTTDSRIPCESCHSPHGQSRIFKATWLATSYGGWTRGDLDVSTNYLLQQREFKLCSLCVEKGIKGSLAIGGATYDETITLVEEVLG